MGFTRFEAALQRVDLGVDLLDFLSAPLFCFVVLALRISEFCEPLAFLLLVLSGRLSEGLLSVGEGAFVGALSEELAKAAGLGRCIGFPLGCLSRD